MKSGEHTAVFRLEHSALRPLVDVGRVFGMAAGRCSARSTRERFALARTLLPEHESIFREASETLRILLWQQARVGIGQGTDGSELPPALLSRHDRHVLKSGFRSILRLLEFTGDSPWLARLTEPSFFDRYRAGFETHLDRRTPIDECASSCSIRRRPDSILETDRLITIGAVAVPPTKSGWRIPSTRC